MPNNGKQRASPASERKSLPVHPTQCIMRGNPWNLNASCAENWDPDDAAADDEAADDASSSTSSARANRIKLKRNNLELSEILPNPREIMQKCAGNTKTNRLRCVVHVFYMFSTCFYNFLHCFYMCSTCVLHCVFTCFLHLCCTFNLLYRPQC